MTVGGGYVSSSGNLHKFLVKATGTAKSGKICTSQTLVGVHICEDDVCSHEPFFLDQDAEGDVGITDENGNVKPVDVPIEPGDHISTGDNGSLRTGLNLNWTLDQLAKNQGVASPTGTGSTGTGMFVGSNTNVDWLDPLSRIPVPWLRWPTAEQIAKMTGLVVLHAAGKSFMNWQEHGVSRTQTILFARSPAEDDYSWAARVQGTRLFIESTKDGSTAAITVMEDFGRESAVEVWNLKNPNERLTVHGGEQLVVRAGKANPPVKVSINPKIEVDPFGILQKWGRLAPASPESLAALTTPPMKEFVGNGCPVCGRVNETSRKFCVYCGTNMERPKKQPPEKHEPPGPELSGPCPNCGREISTKLKFCTYCGANLGPSVAKETTQKKAKPSTARAETCRNCGREIAAGLKFCIYCGTRR